MAKKNKKETTEEVVEEVKKDDNVTKVNLDEPVEDLIDDNVIKVNLDKPPVQEETKEEVVVEDNEDAGVVEVTEQPKEEVEQEEKQEQVVEEITEEQAQEAEELVVEATEAMAESIETGKELPENIQKLVNFMEETGGDINDYVKLNQDYGDMDNHTLLHEYYKQTKPHLSNDEIDFVMEDTFAYDEEVDEEKDIKRKKLAMKEQVAQARQHLESVKSKYYEDIKAGVKLTEEQQKAINFFNRYNKESEQNRLKSEEQAKVFKNKTNQIFNKNFKGFEYNVGDKKFRFNVKDAEQVKETQSDINNFIKRFLTKDNLIDDASAYHKGLFTAMNPDQIATHFYEQGKADALKESIAKSKNVDMAPRQSMENYNTSGFTVRALNDDGPDFKFKIRNKNK
jgi:hypothetical protein